MSPLVYLAAVAFAAIVGRTVAGLIVDAADAAGLVWRPPKDAADRLATLLDPPPAVRVETSDWSGLLRIAEALPPPEPRPLALRVARAAGGAA